MENFNILQKRENALFKRKEIQVSVISKITPNHADVKKLLSEKFSTKTENLKIKKISGKFGSKNFTIIANIYDSEEDKNKIESKSKKEEAEAKALLQKEEKPVVEVSQADEQKFGEVNEPAKEESVKEEIKKEESVNKEETS